jgi:hypothetical protein
MEFPNLLQEISDDPAAKMVLRDIKARPNEEHRFSGRFHRKKEELIKLNVIKYIGGFKFEITELGKQLLNVMPLSY